MYTEFWCESMTITITFRYFCYPSIIPNSLQCTKCYLMYSRKASSMCISTKKKTCNIWMMYKGGRIVNIVLHDYMTFNCVNVWFVLLSLRVHITSNALILKAPPKNIGLLGGPICAEFIRICCCYCCCCCFFSLEANYTHFFGSDVRTNASEMIRRNCTILIWLKCAMNDAPFTHYYVFRSHVDYFHVFEQMIVRYCDLSRSIDLVFNELHGF